MTEPIALIAGGGGASGAATCRALRDQGYHVVCAGRDVPSLERDVGHDADAFIAIELSSEQAVQRALGSLPAVDVLVYNAGLIHLAPFMDTTAEMFTQSWQNNTLGAFFCARAVVPGMLQRGRGALVFMGATASLRGGARSHAFASAKHALRGLAASLARELGPRGVHVAHLVVDGKVWGERTVRRFPNVSQEQCLAPEAVANAVAMLVAQPATGWSFELDLRPPAERW
jgi:NAD(P)-dependent dehydrogenase (short-subunit alcohol dehydrogenase family)